MGMSANRRADQFRFGTSINKDVVRRILAAHYQPTSTGVGPSWLTFIGHMKDSLWSLDSFRCDRPANILGAGRHGPIDAPNHRIRDPTRSAVISVSSMGGEPSNSGRYGN